MKKSLFVVLLLLGLTRPFCSWGNTKLLLVENSLARCSIVVSENADPIETHAAEELAFFIKKASGAELKIAHAPEAGLIPVRLGCDPDASALGNQGFIIQTTRQQLSITGKKPIGVLYGVYEFLENYLGCRWLAPYPDCEFIPESKTIAIDSGIKDLQNPAYEERNPLPTGGNAGGGKGARDTWNWTVRNKMQIIVPEIHYKAHYDFLRARGAVVRAGGHTTFTAAVPDRKYFESNPEYFCLVDGKRVMQKPPTVEYPDGGHTFAQVCTTHPDVIRLCSEYIIDFFDKYPEGIYLLGGGDGNAKWCECENCRKLDPPGSTSVSTRFAVFANAVTESVLKEKPSANMQIWAYSIYRDPPVGVKLHPHLTVSFCPHGRSYKDTLDNPDCQVNVKYQKLFEDWQQQADRLIMREYVGCGYPSCHPSWDTLAADLRTFHKTGKVIGWLDEVNAPDSTYIGKFDTPFRRRAWRARWQYLYLAAKMLWNPDVNERETLHQARSIYYGKAAPVMEKYFDTLEQAWKQTPGAIGWSVVGAKATVGKTLTLPGVQAKLEASLKEAQQAASDNPDTAAKIKEEIAFFAFYWVQNLQEYKARQKPALSAQRVARPVVISGHGDDPQWRNAEAIADFHTPSNEAAKYETGFKILFDDENFYLLVEALEPETDKLVMRSRPRDGNVWEDDDIEIFLYAPELRHQVYWQFAVNPLGSIFDSEWRPGMNGNAAFNAEMEVKTAILQDRWIAEMQIPVKSLGARLVDGSRWKINVARSRKAKGQNMQGELSSLSGSAFHDFESFRDFNLGKSLIPNGSFADLIDYKGKRPETIEGDAPGKFPDKWGISAPQGEIRKTASGHAVHFSTGTIYVFIGNIPASGITLSVEASGTGKLDARFRCWTLRKHLNRNSERVNDRFRKQCDAVQLSGEKQILQFDYVPEEAGEEGYVYLYVLGGDAEISNVTGRIKDATQAP